MASLTIRKFDDQLKQKLRVRAAARGISMEEQARRILAENLGIEPDIAQLVQTIPTEEQKKKAAEVMAWVRSLPKGEPLDERYVTLDHKTLTDMMWDGEL